MAVSAPELPVSKPLEAPLTHRLARRATEYARLMRLDRPVGTWLLLWPALWALWIAGDGRPVPLVLIVFVLGVFVMRAAGCVINDFADRDIDPHVRRTRDRPLAARRVSPTEALVLFVALGLIALYLVTRLDPLHHQAGRHRRAAHRLLSVPQALLPAAAAVPRHLLRRLERARWPSRRRTACCRASPGCCTSPRSCGPRSTTPSTPWSTARTTSRSA